MQNIINNELLQANLFAGGSNAVAIQTATVFGIVAVAMVMGWVLFMRDERQSEKR